MIIRASKRRWLSGAVLVAGIASFTPANAQIVQVIMAVVSAIADQQTNADREKWQSQVSDKLDQLIDQNFAIQEQIRELGAKIPHMLDEAEDRSWTSKGEAEWRQFDQYRFSHNTAELKRLRINVDQTTGFFANRGLSVYPTFASMTILSYLVGRDAGIGRKELKHQLDVNTATLTMWAGDTAGNFGDLINHLTGDIKRGEDSLPKGSVPFGTEPTTGYFNNGTSIACHGVVWGNANVDLKNLTFHIDGVGVRPASDCNGARVDIGRGAPSIHQAHWGQSLAAQLATIKNQRDQLAKLQEYQSEIKNIVAALKSLM